MISYLKNVQIRRIKVTCLHISDHEKGIYDLPVEPGKFLSSTREGRVQVILDALKHPYGCSPYCYVSKRRRR